MSAAYKKPGPFKSRTLEPYKAYNFRDKDPVIDELRTLVEQELGRRIVRRRDLRFVEANGGPRVSTMANWFFGKTRRPVSAGAESCGRACGYYRPWVRMPHNLAVMAKRGAVNKKKPRLRVVTRNGVAD